ncbi:hypothetical protein VIGAN_09166900, partial [Vigna angularis var. angularis]
MSGGWVRVRLTPKSEISSSHSTIFRGFSFFHNSIKFLHSLPSTRPKGLPLPSSLRALTTKELVRDSPVVCTPFPSSTFFTYVLRCYNR